MHLNHRQGDVALNLYDFVVRRPDRPAEKYGLRAYDETILAPMVTYLTGSDARIN
jgi:actin-related protein 8